MRAPKRPLTIARIQNTTAMCQDAFNRYCKAIADPDRAKRLKAQECPICFYVDHKIGGAAITSTNCGHCNQELSFGSTNVDILCEPCARHLKLCRHCAADINLKSRQTNALQRQLDAFHPNQPSNQPEPTSPYHKSARR